MFIFKKYLLICIVTFFGIQLINSQNTIKISGKIIVNNMGIVNIHVLNKSTNKGTITDIDGRFLIEVNLGDVLLFSGIQFTSVEKIINKKMIANKIIELELDNKVYNLNIVTVKQHNLQGLLRNDIKKVPKNFKKHSSFKIDVSDIDFSEPITINKPSDIRITDPLKNSETVQGLNLMPLLSKIFRRKKKVEHFKFSKSASKKVIKAIREKLGDDFFIIELKISRVVIDDFISYCNSKEIILLYNQNKSIELIEILISKSTSYKKKLTKN